MKYTELQTKDNKLVDISLKYESGRQYGNGSTENRAIIHDNKNYMAKFMEKKIAFHYSSKPYTYFNSIFSEHIACSIGKKIGLNIQKTQLGYDVIDNEYIPCVLCEDFCSDSEIVYSFKTLVNNINLEYKASYSDRKLKDILKVIELQSYINKKELKEKFLDMVIFDSFIGNFDRNLKNFGLIKNESFNTYRIAPIYDCASSLHPKTSRDRIENYLESIVNYDFLKEKTFDIPTSYFTDDKGKKINYYEFLVEKKFNHDKDIAEAIKRIVPKILENMIYINDLMVLCK